LVKPTKQREYNQFVLLVNTIQIPLTISIQPGSLSLANPEITGQLFKQGKHRKRVLERFFDIYHLFIQVTLSEIGKSAISFSRMICCIISKPKM
jgi:hypothetical protein